MGERILQCCISFLPLIQDTIEFPLSHRKRSLHHTGELVGRQADATAHKTGDRFESLYVPSPALRTWRGRVARAQVGRRSLQRPIATVQVRRTLSETRPGHKSEKPKKGLGRSVRCSQKATEALRRHRVPARGEAGLCGRIMTSSSRPRRGPP